MYKLLNEVTLVQDQQMRRSTDGVVYREDTVIEGVRLWVEYHPQEPSSLGPEKPFPRYGTIYQDTSERWCVVPDTWDQRDADMAKDAIVKGA